MDASFVCLLLLAEGYAFMVLALGYIQMLWPLRRAPVPLPDDPDEWPAVDLLIPTYDEPLSVVRFTALAAMNIDWPADKLNVYILDDGRREEFRAFAEEAGIGYISRDKAIGMPRRATSITRWSRSTRHLSRCSTATTCRRAASCN